MKVLHINEKALSGGAAICMRRLHSALTREGHCSQMFVARQTDGVEGAIRMPGPSILDRLSFHALNLAGLNFAGMTGLRRILTHPVFAASDLVHLHNLHGGYFNYRWLPEISRRKPVVWTFHDMWPVTGHCAHSFDCARWKTGCGKCPYPTTYPAVRMDATSIEWRIKRAVYARSDITAVCPSRWMAGIASESPLVSFPVRHINNGIDTDVFAPSDRAAARRSLGLPQEKTVIVFVADSLRNPFKDFSLLVAALQGMSRDDKERCALLLIGGGAVAPGSFDGFHVVSCGYVEDDARKALILGAADFMAFPSKADNQPLVVLEAMACGCPVVATTVGGIPELVVDGETGVLVRDPSPDSFRQAIRSAMRSGARLADMAAKARAKAVADHSLSSCAGQYIGLYMEAAASRGAGNGTQAARGARGVHK
jgi:glycosyltransferase involved in cell wall biosynthesis